MTSMRALGVLAYLAAMSLLLWAWATSRRRNGK